MDRSYTEIVPYLNRLHDVLDTAEVFGISPRRAAAALLVKFLDQPNYISLRICTSCELSAREQSSKLLEKVTSKQYNSAD